MEGDTGKYWINGAGYKDPTVAEVIEQENINEKARNKQVHDTIREVKNLLASRNLKLLSRLQIEDKTTKREYK